MLIPIWLWSASNLSSLFKDTKDDEDEEAEEYEVEGLTPLAQAVWKLLYHYSDWASLTVVPNLPAEGLHNARQACNVPPDERILALLDFTGDEDDCSRSLLFGCRGFYCHAVVEGKETAVAIPYEEFPRRTFVNHGLAVYLGKGQMLKPDLDESPVDCETITELLIILQKGIVEFEQQPAPPPAEEKVTA
jgi:hypothetical protein